MEVTVLRHDVEIPTAALVSRVEYPEWMVDEVKHCHASGKATELRLPDGPIETRGKDANTELAALRRAWSRCVEKHYPGKTGRMSLERVHKSKENPTPFVKATVWVADKRPYTAKPKGEQNPPETKGE